MPPSLFVREFLIEAALPPFAHSTLLHPTPIIKSGVFKDVNAEFLRLYCVN